VTEASEVVVFIDGQQFAGPDARVSVFDRGFLYGDSVFETIRTYGGRPFALDEHLDRLARSAELVFIPLPCGLEQLRGEVSRAVATVSNRESYIRVMVTRGQGELGLDPGLAHQPLRVIIVAPLHPVSPAVYDAGAAAVTFRTLRPSDATVAEGAKIGNYLVAVLAMREAKKVQANEALIVDREGRVVEGATSNVFVVNGDALITPPLEAGILAGVTRNRAIKAAEQLGLRVKYEALQVQEVREASELFVSSSIRELLPITTLDGSPIGDGRVGPVTRRVRERFRLVIEHEMLTN
jgi:branched-chain amino acid aminotransferase